MLDIFKRPVVIIIVLVGIVIAMVWSYFSQRTADNQAAKVTSTNIVTTLDLTTADAEDFDEVIRNELALANEKAVAAAPVNKLVAVEYELPSLQIKSGDARYIFSQGETAADNWTITYAQSSGSSLRAVIPKEDYLGSLPPINFNLWKFNYVTAIQIFEKNGGMDWRNNNGLSSIRLTLKHGGQKNWLMWYVVYKSGDASYEKMIDANSGKIVEEQ